MIVHKNFPKFPGNSRKFQGTNGKGKGGYSRFPTLLSNLRNFNKFSRYFTLVRCLKFLDFQTFLTFTRACSLKSFKLFINLDESFLFLKSHLVSGGAIFRKPWTVRNLSYNICLQNVQSHQAETSICSGL